MTVLRVCYKSGVRFDQAYYTSKHMPMVGSIMGPFGVSRVEVVRFGANPDGSAPLYQVMFSAYFQSADALQKALQGPRIGEVMADISNYYDGVPDLFIGEEIALSA